MSDAAARRLMIDTAADYQPPACPTSVSCDRWLRVPDQLFFGNGGPTVDALVRGEQQHLKHLAQNDPVLCRVTPPSRCIDVGFSLEAVASTYRDRRQQDRVA